MMLSHPFFWFFEKPESPNTWKTDLVNLKELLFFGNSHNSQLKIIHSKALEFEFG
jgi:hypothetical protein